MTKAIVLPHHRLALNISRGIKKMGDKEDEKKVFVKVIIEESTEQIDIDI